MRSAHLISMGPYNMQPSLLANSVHDNVHHPLLVTLELCECSIITDWKSVSFICGHEFNSLADPHPKPRQNWGHVMFLCEHSHTHTHTAVKAICKPGVSLLQPITVKMAQKSWGAVLVSRHLRLHFHYVLNRTHFSRVKGFKCTSSNSKTSRRQALRRKRRPAESSQCSHPILCVWPASSTGPLTADKSPELSLSSRQSSASHPCCWLRPAPCLSSSLSSQLCSLLCVWTPRVCLPEVWITSSLFQVFLNWVFYPRE